jgi:GT2 family glycosyltransferase
MAAREPDQYEEIRHRLGIVNLLDFSPYEPGDPLLVRQVRRLDHKLKRNRHIVATAKQLLPIVRRIKRSKDRVKKVFINDRSEIITNNSRPQISSKPIHLPATTTKPDVSIVIPVFNKIEVTLNCLKSLAQLNRNLSFEVIIVDDASTDSTKIELSKLDNLIYICNSENLGFVDSCNAGANKARGDILIFLNNDTEVMPTWLNYLVAPLSNSTIGLVGSKLLYPDGSLQEAGGIIFNDGSGTNYGKHQNADYFQFNYRRDVDYCSGASIAIHTSLFRKLGGFDRRFVPAYYEDTDLAFQVRSKGLRVVYEPRSVAYHIEGESAGTNINSGMKRFQAINHKKFVDKWGTVLHHEHYPPEEWYLGRDRSASKLALIIDDRIPTPDKDSGSQRMVRLIQNIQKLDYKVTFWPRNLEYDKKYTNQLQVEGVEVVYGTVGFLAFASQFGRYYNLIILSRPYTAASYLEACRAWFYKATILYDTVDLHFLRTERQAQADSRHIEGLLDQARNYRELEIGIGRRTNCTLVVSDEEKKLIRSIDPSINVAVVSNIHHIVPEAYNHSFSKRKNLLFIGGFDHLPNQDAIKWFSKEILPLIRQQLPDIILKVIGANMPPSLVKILSGIPGIEVLGYVEDISNIFMCTRVFVCPLRYGAGVKGKLGQAIEYGMPIVSTTIGIEGMHLEDSDSCLVADNAVDFANAVLRIYTNQALWESARNAAREILEKYFSDKAAQEGIITALAATHK